MLFAASGFYAFCLGALAFAGCSDSAKQGDGASTGGHTSGGSSAGFGASGSSGKGSSSGASGVSQQGGSSGASSGGGAGSAGEGAGGESTGSGAASGRGGSGGGRAGSGAVAGRAGSGGASAGSAGSATAGAAPSADCSGQFGEPRVVLDSGVEVRVYSPTLSRDELELLYSATDAASAKTFRRSTRASKLDAFEPGESLPELDAACAPSEDRTLDLTPDGLRAYIGCYDPTVSFSGSLRVARRASPDAAFVLDAESYGTVGASPSIAADELTVYTSGFDASQEAGLVYERAAPDAPFADGFEIPGLNGRPAQGPDISVNGLALFFGDDYGVWAATRESPDVPFSTLDPVIEAAADPRAASWLSPAISDDCRSLYAVRYVADTGAGEPSWTLEVLER